MKVRSRGYRLTLTEEEDGSWTVEAPDLPGMVAAGPSVAAAMRRLPDAIDSWMAGARQAGISVPQPSKVEDEYSGRFVVRIARTLHRRLARAAEDEGVSLNALCQTLLATGLERLRVDRTATSSLMADWRETFIRAAGSHRLQVKSFIQPGIAEEQSNYFARTTADPIVTSISARKTDLALLFEDEDAVLIGAP